MNQSESSVPMKRAIIRDLFMGSEESTFKYDEDLPPLPVPPLHQTLERYLKSIEPFVQPEQYQRTQQIVENFEKGIGKHLHEKLLERAAQTKNWLSDWWLKYAYLTFRDPLSPCMHMAGIQSLNTTIWQSDEEAALERLAMKSWCILDFYRNVREENVKPQTNKKGAHLSMDQFHYFFNTVRIPKEGVDEIHSYFRTKAEGDCPNHFIIICFGHIWVMNPWGSSGESLTIPEIEEQLKYIQKISEALGEGLGIGCLTFDNREMWAKNRRWLMSLSEQNEKNIDLIERSIMVYTMDEHSPKDVTEANQMCLCGNPVNRWADKTFNAVSFKNGFQGSSNDHSPLDAMVSVMLNHYQHDIISEEFQGKWRGPKNVREDICMPKRLVFDFDDLLISSIKRIKQLNYSIKKNIVVLMREFNIFGKDRIKRYNLSPDSFVQCALQLAYYQMHKRFAPTYETATTREFYKGRTETVRSCTTDVTEFVKSMGSSETTSVKKTKLIKAISGHSKLMSECKRGNGIDRHLMGLSIIAAENGMPMPELFTDPSYEMSGGNGNFVLSTSSAGQTYVTGGVPAMVKDGYGVFYVFFPHKEGINFYISGYTNESTCVNKFFQSVSQALIYIDELMAGPEAKL